MSSLFSEEAKRRLELNLLNQLAMPSSLEPGPSHDNARYFSPNDVFTVLYGKNTARQVSKDEGRGTQAIAQYGTAERINTACELCQTMPHGACPMHRQPTKPLTDGRLSYAFKSLPPECRLDVSNSAGEGYGVYTNQLIPTGTWIGPFEGKRIRPCDVTQQMDTSHMWEIYEGTTLSHYIDGRDENCSSWMRFIRCARHKGEQNLFAFQYNGNIYYRAFKDIPTGTELLVWYDEQYPMYMGIPLGVQVDAIPTTPTAATLDRKQDGTAFQQSSRASNPVPSQIKPQDTTRYTRTVTNSQLTPSRSPLRVCQETRQSATDTKKLPPLIPTYSLHQRRASSDNVLRNQRSPATSDVDSDASNLGNNKVPSPTSPVSELTSWRCQQCHKTFTQRVALQMHVCPCQPNKPFQCGQCSNTFTNSSDLRAHVVSHTTERPFKCGFCSRTFVGATTLNNHVRTHMGEKPFSCEKCGMTFSQAMHLSKHARESCEYLSDTSRADSVTTQALST
ncbi:putative histone-lysine N-methyltransferase PRDM6 [Oculina patagonica]